MNQLKKEGHDAEVVSGYVSHAWVICHNCTQKEQWFETDGTQIFNYDHYLLKNDIHD